jgi:hypothetical protein
MSEEQQAEDDSKPVSANDLIKRLDKALLKKGINPIKAFQAADQDNSGSLAVREFITALGKLLGTTLPPKDASTLMQTFDSNRNGTIDSKEFVTLIEKARQTSTFTKEIFEKGVSLDQVKHLGGLEVKADGLLVTDQNVLDFCHAVVSLQHTLTDRDTLTSVIAKVCAYRDGLDGNNEEALTNAIESEIVRLE